jgi:hypothetical protein
MTHPMRPFERCKHCDHELTAPEWSELVTPSRMCHWWRCRCGCKFETFEDLPTEARFQPEIVEQFLSSLIVA